MLDAGVDFLAQPEADIERDLLITAAARVNFIGKGADGVFEFANDQGVDVFIGGPFVERRVAGLFAEGFEGAEKLSALARRQDADAFKRPREGLRAADI